jgi:hypothetical protein
MVVKYTKDGIPYGSPPYTKAEEDEFYRRNANGPVATHGRKEPKSQQEQKPSAAKPSKRRPV